MKVPRRLGKGTVAAGWSVVCQVEWVDSAVQTFVNLSGSTIAQREMLESTSRDGFVYFPFVLSLSSWMSCSVGHADTE